MRTRWISALSFAILAVVFIADVKTPQALVLAILLNVPIVLSAFVGSRTLTTWLVVVALIANVAAGYINGVQEGGWDVTGVWNRAMAALSIVMVGWLGTTLQERARRVGHLAERETRARREGQLAVAIDRVRASLSHDLVLRAIVREALHLFEGESASWIPADRSDGDGVLVVNRGDSEVRLDSSIASPEFASLARRSFDDDDIVLLEQRDPVGGLALDRIGAKAALIIPVVERGTALGIVLVSSATSYGASDDGTRMLARAFGRSSSAALAQARLFAQLAERNEELAERSSVIRDLVYALSHDLRTPLAALGLTFRQAKDGLYGTMPVTYGHIVDRSIIATDELQRLADTLLLVARFESGERRSRREAIDVDGVVREVAGELQPIASARDVALVFEAASHAQVQGDRSDLRRAVTNLVANALEHTPAGGHVEVATQRDDATVTIAVTDDGPGVGPEARSTLFQRFAAGQGRRGGGSGLGLYIVRRVAEETGGSAHYQLREPQGSIFTITAPLLAVNESVLT